MILINHKNSFPLNHQFVVSQELVKMSNRNSSAQCTVCKKWMRSDKVKRHVKTHKDLLSLPAEEIKEELRSRHAIEKEREVKQQQITTIALEEGLPIPQEILDTQPLDKDDLRTVLSQNNQRYLEKIELGKNISTILDEGIVQEDSLTKDHRHALEIYRRQEPRCDIPTVQLRVWQEDAMKLIESPSDRQVIWISGRQGHEGKSWFQNYVESYFGYHRVARCDLRIKHANVCNVLKKRSLASVNIFLFNDARSVTGEEINLYRILEDIKDGQATASKYDNNNIRFKTPNTVMVFSNGYPKLGKLSRDRWRIFNANQDKLHDVTLQVMNMKKGGYNPQNNDHLGKYKL